MTPRHIPGHPENGRGATWVDRLARGMERAVPDAITTSILLLIVMFALSLALGTEVPAAMDGKPLF